MLKDFGKFSISLKMTIKLSNPISKGSWRHPMFKRFILNSNSFCRQTTLISSRLVLTNLSTKSVIQSLTTCNRTIVFIFSIHWFLSRNPHAKNKPFPAGWFESYLILYERDRFPFTPERADLKRNTIVKYFSAYFSKYFLYFENFKSPIVMLLIGNYLHFPRL